MKERTFLMAVGLVATLMVSAGCWVPEDFGATINVKKNGTYSLEYSGKLAFAPIAAEAKKRKLTAEEDSQMRELVPELLKEREFTAARYVGQGRFAVTWKSSGRLTGPVYFMSEDLDYFSVTPLGNDKVLVTGTAINERDLAELRSAGVKLEGDLDVDTDCKVVESNATSEPWFFGIGSHEWHVAPARGKSTPRMVLNCK